MDEMLRSLRFVEASNPHELGTGVTGGVGMSPDGLACGRNSHPGYPVGKTEKLESPTEDGGHHAHAPGPAPAAAAATSPAPCRVTHTSERRLA